MTSVSPLITELGSVSFIRLLLLACEISNCLFLSKICPIGYLAFKKQMLIATHFIAIWRASVYRSRSKILLMIVFLALSWLQDSKQLVVYPTLFLLMYTTRILVSRTFAMPNGVEIEWQPIRFLSYGSYLGSL